MILFKDSTSIQGADPMSSLAYVNNCNIDSSRTNMSGVVTLSIKRNEPDYTPYNTIPTYNVPYDPNLAANPTEQFYSWLMTQPMYAGGVKYPVVES